MNDTVQESRKYQERASRGTGLPGWYWWPGACARRRGIAD